MLEVGRKGGDHIIHTYVVWEGTGDKGGGKKGGILIKATQKGITRFRRRGSDNRQLKCENLDAS